MHAARQSASEPARAIERPWFHDCGGMGESSCMMVVRVVGVWQHMAIEGLMVGGNGLVVWWLLG